jgi:hypothetical protein
MKEARWSSSRALRGAFGGVCGESDMSVRSIRVALAFVVSAGAVPDAEAEADAEVKAGAVAMAGAVVIAGAKFWL